MKQDQSPATTKPLAGGFVRKGGQMGPSQITERPSAPAPMRSSRSDKDYAIEFGRYLAVSAERYQAAVNSYHSARDGGCDQSMEDAAAEMTEAYTRLSSDIYEFRKRMERANG